MDNSNTNTLVEEFEIVVQSDEDQCKQMSIRVNDFSNLIISKNHDLIAHVKNMMFGDVDLENSWVYSSEGDIKELKTALTKMFIKAEGSTHVNDFLICLGRDDETSPQYATIISHDNSIEGFRKLNKYMEQLKSEGRINQDAFIAYNDLGIDSW